MSLHDVITKKTVRKAKKTHFGRFYGRFEKSFPFCHAVAGLERTQIARFKAPECDKKKHSGQRKAQQRKEQRNVARYHLRV
ncbi:hypothetical protein SDC9_148637 [bioreactor metagenome]|uniref:Uncharacterized protein n=1 Tax=bioreactor metagenome TaxID=1076179 RepID=A0A645EHE0_9ZZZZ